MLETALTAEPEGLLVADYDGRAIGCAIARVGQPHPLTGLLQGRLEALTVAPGWRSQGIAERLIKEAEAYLTPIFGAGRFLRVADAEQLPARLPEVFRGLIG